MYIVDITYGLKWLGIEVNVMKQNGRFCQQESHWWIHGMCV